MRIEDIAKFKWERGEEWFEKWYNTEQCFLAFHYNPLTESFLTQGLNSVTLNSRWFYEINTSQKWDIDRENAVSQGSQFFVELISNSKRYLTRVEKSLKKAQKTSEINPEVFKLIKSALMDLWYVFLADLGKFVGKTVNQVLNNKNLTEKQIKEIKDYYLTCHTPLAYQVEEEELQRITRVFKQRGISTFDKLNQLPDDILKLLELHQKRFAWLTVSNLDTEPYTIKDYFLKLKDLINSKYTPKARPKLSEKTEHLLIEDDLFLLDLINQHIYLDNYAADLGDKIDFVLQKLLSKKYNLSFQDISWYTFSELEALVKEGTKLSKGELSARKQHRVMAQINGEIGVFYGKRNSQKAILFLNTDEVKSVDSFRGIIASSGRVNGPVKIVKGIKDIKKIKEGDILVATTTRADLMPAIRRCAAIVTDSGGITSHAAIVSRELDIPCIVGSEIATQILKDGDFVEVDANRGIVKKLKKSK